MPKKLLSIVTPCYNEAGNAEELYRQIKAVMEAEPAYDYEHIYIDNASKDETVRIVKRIAEQDKRVKLIVNARNFGHIRSPYYGMLQASGDGVICMASDLQDPPEVIHAFLRKWEEGFRVVAAVKSRSYENFVIYRLRSMYYKLIRKLANVELLEHFTGFGLYDRKVMDVLRGLREPYPYFRGLISDIGFDIARVEFVQPLRKHGKTSNNFYTLFDMAMLGFTNHTKVPLRLATIVGFGAACFSLLIGFGYLVAKLLFWYTFSAGSAPAMIGIFFLGSIQLFFLGVVGEYVGAMFTYTQNRPLVIERERVNFENSELAVKGGKAGN